MNPTLVFLRIGSIGLSAEYRNLVDKDIQLKHFTNSFHQDWEEHAGVTSAVRGGSITMVIDDFPTAELIDWGLNSRKYGWGEVVVLDQLKNVVEKISFECAACTDFKIHYIEHGEAYFCTTVTINAQSLSVGGRTAVEHDWKNVNE